MVYIEADALDPESVDRAFARLAVECMQMEIASPWHYWGKEGVTTKKGKVEEKSGCSIM
jgi:hypothetical protein